jgi:hypothetical protein
MRTILAKYKFVVKFRPHASGRRVRLKQWHGIAMRSDKLLRSYLAASAAPPP